MRHHEKQAIDGMCSVSTQKMYLPADDLAGPGIMFEQVFISIFELYLIMEQKESPFLHSKTTMSFFPQTVIFFPQK